MEINELIFKRKPVKIILGLRKKSKKNNTERAKEIECDYHEYNRTIKKFKEAGIVTVKKKGRECLIILNRKGKIIANKLMIIKNE